ncbi:MAG TPA: hypothetical protein VFI48_10555, partial [Hyphomicrobiaceae bacterium]|nr:hypothetical protein [Hyphomicrobiaceae bacterium]
MEACSALARVLALGGIVERLSRAHDATSFFWRWLGATRELATLRRRANHRSLRFMADNEQHRATL